MKTRELKRKVRSIKIQARYEVRDQTHEANQCISKQRRESPLKKCWNSRTMPFTKKLMKETNDTPHSVHVNLKEKNKFISSISFLLISLHNFALREVWNLEWIYFSSIKLQNKSVISNLLSPTQLFFSDWNQKHDFI